MTGEQGTKQKVNRIDVYHNVYNLVDSIVHSPVKFWGAIIPTYAAMLDYRTQNTIKKMSREKFHSKLALQIHLVVFVSLITKILPLPKTLTIYIFCDSMKIRATMVRGTLLTMMYITVQIQFYLETIQYNHFQFCLVCLRVCLKCLLCGNLTRIYCVQYTTSIIVAQHRQESENFPPYLMSSEKHMNIIWHLD